MGYWPDRPWQWPKTATMVSTVNTYFMDSWHNMDGNTTEFYNRNSDTTLPIAVQMVLLSLNFTTSAPLDKLLVFNHINQSFSVSIAIYYHAVWTIKIKRLPATKYHSCYETQKYIQTLLCKFKYTEGKPQLNILFWFFS